METVLAVDLGGTRTRVAVAGPQAGIADRTEVPTRHIEAQPDYLVAIIGKMRDRHEISRAVIGLAGRIDYREGRLEWAPNLPPTWAAHLTANRLAGVTGVPTALANDADVAAVGEAYFGAGRGYRDVVYMTVSTGVGAGVVLAGRLVAGPRSGVEIGHVVIDREAARQAARRPWSNWAPGRPWPGWPPRQASPSATGPWWTWPSPGTRGWRTAGPR